MRRDFSARQTPRAIPRTLGEYQTVRAQCPTVRTESSASFCPISIPYSTSLVKCFCKKIFFLFFGSFRATATYLRHSVRVVLFSKQFGVFGGIFLLCVSILTKFSTKNRLKWIFTKFAFGGIIIMLSAAPTPQRHAQRT